MFENSHPLPPGGIDIYFVCEGQGHDEPAVTDLTGLTSGGTPICTEEDCPEFDSDMTLLGWAPQGAIVRRDPVVGWIVDDWDGSL